MNLFLYRRLLWLALPWVRLRLYLRGRREPAYNERIGERFGRVPAEVGTRPIWFHTVSAGETIAAAPIIRAIAGEFSTDRILVTTMTPTGSGEVVARLGGLVEHCYAPYDFTFAVRRFLDRVRPRLLVLMETELWPNLIYEAGRRDIPVLCINARLSARSARGYAKIARLTARMLAQIRFIACQYDEHVGRFVALGADPEKVAAYGNIKFDLQLPRDLHGQRAALKARLGLHERPVWIAASTHPGEDEWVLDAFAQVRKSVPQLCLLLVPRHPVRADVLVRLAHARGYTAARQSDPGVGAGSDVVVGDLMGALLQLYGLADVAFVGGSFVPVGGHNPIEPALWQIPVISGPQQFNFADVMQQLERAGGLLTVNDARDLAVALERLLMDPACRSAMGRKAGAVVAQNRGASEKLLALLRIEIAGAAQ